MTAEGGAPRASLLALAPWPQLDGLDDEKAEAEIGWVVDLVSAIRSVRAEMNVSPATPMPLVLAGASADTRARAGRWGDFLKRACAARRHHVRRRAAAGLGAAPGARRDRGAAAQGRGRSRRRARAAGKGDEQGRGRHQAGRRQARQCRFPRPRARGGGRGASARSATRRRRASRRSSRRWSGSRAPPDVDRRMLSWRTHGTCPGSKSGATLSG